MQHLYTQELDEFTATIRHSTRLDGDLSTSTVEPEMLGARRAAALNHPWFTVRQVHSDRVVVVDELAHAGPGRRPVADAVVTSVPQQVVAVQAGDCAPIGFVHAAGTVAAAHAGWAGLEAGVLEATVRRLRETSGASDDICAVVGPHIRVDRYEFGEADLARLARRLGDDVIGETAEGRPAFDLTAGLTAELARLDVRVAVSSPDCTAAQADRYWSHRARHESGRIALIAWLEER